MVIVGVPQNAIDELKDSFWPDWRTKGRYKRDVDTGDALESEDDAEPQFDARLA